MKTPPRGKVLSTRSLAQLLAAAQEAGCVGTVMSLARSWQAARRRLGQLLDLREQVGGEAGWAHLCQLLEAVEEISRRTGEGVSVEQALAATDVACEQLLLAARLQRRERQWRRRGQIDGLIESLEQRVAGRAQAAGFAALQSELEGRVARVETAIEQLSAGAREKGRIFARAPEAEPPRLDAPGLARLLEVSSRHQLEALVQALIWHSWRGSALYRHLEQLGARVGKRNRWAHLAQLLAMVDELAERPKQWPLLLAERAGRGLGLGELRAAAQLRLAEHRGWERKAMAEVVERLGELVEGEGTAEQGEGEAPKEKP
jgi:hypothetical protein